MYPRTPAAGAVPPLGADEGAEEDPEEGGVVGVVMSTYFGRKRIPVLERELGLLGHAYEGQVEPEPTAGEGTKLPEATPPCVR